MGASTGIQENGRGSDGGHPEDLTPLLSVGLDDLTGLFQTIL